MKKIVSKSKLIFDAIGSSGGVAWTSFGIISSALSLGIGGTAIAGLGFFCSILFLVISVEVFYLNYKKNQLDEFRFNEKISINFSNFIKILHCCYRAEKARNEQLNFSSYLHEITTNMDNNIQTKFIKFVMDKFAEDLNYDEPFSSDQNKGKLTKIINDFLDSTNLPEYVSPSQDNGYLDSALLNFISVFGSVAGSSSGFIGVCVGLGVITGFSALPLLGAIVLTAAILSGFCASVLAVQYNREIYKVKQMYKSFKNFNEAFLDKLKTNKANQIEQEQALFSENTEETVGKWRAVATPSSRVCQSLIQYREQLLRSSPTSSQPQDEQHVSQLISTYNTL